MYHAQRHATKIVIVMLLVLGGFAAIAIAQPVDFGQLDAQAIAGAVESSGVIKMAPGWLVPIIPALVVALCSVINALVPNEKLGKVAGLVNKGALALGKAKVDPEGN